MGCSVSSSAGASTKPPQVVTFNRGDYIRFRSTWKPLESSSPQKTRVNESTSSGAIKEGWVVLAVDFEDNCYAVQRTDGSYVTAVHSEDLELIRPDDWTDKIQDESHDIDEKAEKGETIPVNPFDPSTSSSPNQSKTGSQTLPHVPVFSQGDEVVIMTPHGRYSGLVSFVYADDCTYNVQTDFGDFFPKIAQDAVDKL